MIVGLSLLPFKKLRLRLRVRKGGPGRFRLFRDFLASFNRNWQLSFSPLLDNIEHRSLSPASMDVLESRLVSLGLELVVSTDTFCPG